MRSSRKPRFVLIFLLALCALFVYGYTARMDELAALQGEITVMEARIAEAKQEQERLVEQLAYVNSPDFLDQSARKDFDMGLEGDRLVVPIPQPGRADPSVTGGMVVELPGETGATALGFDPHDLPVWQQWVTFFADSGSTR